MFFHYGSGFEGLFILKELTNRGHAPKVICRGRKFILLEARFNVKVYLRADTSRKNGQKNQSLREEQASWHPRLVSPSRVIFPTTFFFILCEKRQLNCLLIFWLEEKLHPSQARNATYILFICWSFKHTVVKLTKIITRRSEKPNYQPS